MSESLHQRITSICEVLHSAARQTRVLSHLGWHSSVREQFFKNDARELPVVEYPAFDAAPVLAQLEQARSMLQGSSIDSLSLIHI